MATQIKAAKIAANEAPAAPIEQAAPAAPIAPESAKLLELKAKRLQHKVAARNFEPDSDGEAAELLEAYKCDQLIKAEIASQMWFEAEAAKQMERNKRIQLNTTQLEAYKALIVYTSDVNNSDETEDYKKLVDDFKAAKDRVESELLAKFVAAKTTTSKPNGAKTTSNEENDAAASANAAAGMDAATNRKALEANGMPRSTAWFAVDRYKKANPDYK